MHLSSASADRNILQRHKEARKFNVSGLFSCPKFLFVFAKSDRKTVVNEEKKIAALIDFIGAMEIREDDEEFQNPVDIMFENLEKKNPKHFSVS